MKKIIFILAILYSPSLFAATLTANTVPYVCQGGTSPQLCNSNIITDSSGNATSVMPTGTILAEASNNLPAGFLWCNGQAVSRTAYSALFEDIATKYGSGDGSTTFNLPNLMARTIVGLDGMGGATSTNLITLWSTSPATLGGTFGESAHRQAVAEMAPHMHEIDGTAAHYSYPEGGGDPIGYYNGRHEYTGWTNSNGGNADGTGLGAPANVVQPSIAMGYIIKT